MVTITSRRERIDQLAALLDGTLGEDEVRSDVRRLATLATTVTAEVERTELDAEARDRIRTRVMAAVHTDLHEAADERLAPRRTRPVRAAVATGVASAIIGTGGVAVAAQEALPGDALYSIKQATESVRVAAAGDLLAEGRLELQFARERLEEVAAAVDRRGVGEDTLVDTLARMDARTIAGTDTLARLAEREDEPVLLEEIAIFTEQQAAGLTALIDRLPVQVRPRAEESLALLRAIRERHLGVLDADGDVSSAALAGASDAVLGPAPTPADDEDEDDADARDEDRPEPRGNAPTVEPSTGSTPAPTTPSPTPQLPLPSDRPTGGGGDERGEPRRIVPPLPGPLDDVGRGLDDTVGGVLDGTGRLIEDTTGTVGDVLDGVGDVLDGVVDGVGDTVGGLLDGVGGLLRGRGGSDGSDGGS